MSGSSAGAPTGERQRSLPHNDIFNASQLSFHGAPLPSLASKRQRASSADGLRQDAGFADAMNMMSQVMERQNMILQHIAVAMQQQAMSVPQTNVPAQQNAAEMDTQAEMEKYMAPDSLLHDLDPEVRKVFRSWYKESKSLLNSWITQSQLSEKYRLLEEKKMWHRQFQSEALQKWQWPKKYAVNAAPHQGERLNQERAQTDGYDIDAAWCDMRERHAKEAQSFIFEHQKLCTQFFTKLVKPSSMEERLMSDLEDFFSSEACVIPSATQSVIMQMVPQYVSLFLRTEEPHARNRIKATKDANIRKQEEELKAEEAFQSADLRQVIGMAAIEAARMKPGKKAQQVISQKDTLGRLFKDQPDLAKQMNIKTVENKDSVDDKFKNRGRPNDKGTTSRKSSKATTPRSKSALRQPSTPRHKSPKQVRFEAKGKGKNKNRQPTKGKGKGKGKDSAQPPRRS